MKVIHGPVNVGNQPWVLSRYERLQNIDSQLTVNYGTWLGYSADRVLSPSGRRSVWDRIVRLVHGLSVPLRYDVIHLYFGLSFLSWNDYGLRNILWFKDVVIAKALRRKVFMTLQGCDVRISSDSAAINSVSTCHEGNCKSKVVCTSTLDQERKRFIAEVLPLFDNVFVLNPELKRYVPKAEFLPYASVDLENIQETLPRTTGVIRIVHAPSDPNIKGSKFIIQAVEKLKEKYPIEFILVTGVSHEEALTIYQQADLVIDQVLAGWYGGFAVEAMAMGKPVACYIRTEDLKFVPAGMVSEMPIIRLTPSTVESDLEAAILRRNEWQELGRKSRSYVFRWHNPKHIAAAMVRAYRHKNSRFSLEFDE